MEFESAYNDVEVQLVNHYTTRLGIRLLSWKIESTNQVKILDDAF